MKGYFALEVLSTLRKEGSILQGHPDMNKVPGIDMSTGSLGQGLSCGVGMAIAAKREEKPSRVFVLMGDGENNEGQIWEAAMCAAKYKLDNLIGIVDKNNLQNDGSCKDIMPIGDLAAKWRAFGWEVVEIDGHNISEIIGAFDKIRNVKGKPKCIIANTIKGKGVSFMENVFTWHGMAPNAEQYAQAIAEIQGVL
jgi:transketolase